MSSERVPSPARCDVCGGHVRWGEKEKIVFFLSFPHEFLEGRAVQLRWLNHAHLSWPGIPSQCTEVAPESCRLELLHSEQGFFWRWSMCQERRGDRDAGGLIVFPSHPSNFMFHQGLQPWLNTLQVHPLQFGLRQGCVGPRSDWGYSRVMNWFEVGHAQLH